MEKLIKSVNNIKVYYGGEPVDSGKKDPPPMATKNERQECCKTMAECILSTAVKGSSEYTALLGVTLETLLSCCQDAEADVRIAAEESINRVIKGTEELHFGKVLIEFYKEIKRNASSRSLRAALSRFANLAHRIRPSKCRPFIVSLIPAFIRICAREDESVQECLSTSVAKIFPLIGSFASETEVQNLISALMKNLRHSSAAIRRNSATCIYEVISNSNKMLTTLSGSVSKLLDLFSTENMDNNYVLGILTTLRSLVPLFSVDTNISRRTGSFGSDKDTKMVISFDGTILEIFELCTHLFCFSDANIVTASLETLHVLLKLPSEYLAEVFKAKSLSKSEFSDKLFQLSSTLGLPTSAVQPLSNASSRSGGTPNAEASDLQPATDKKEDYLENVEGVSLAVATGQLEVPNTEPLASFLDAITLEDVADGEKSPSPAQDKEQKSSSPIGEESPERSAACGDNALIANDPYTNKVSDLYFKTDPVRVVTQLMCERILKIGSQGTKGVRVSAKNLALSCISAIFKLYPEMLFLSVLGNEKPFVFDIMTYRNFYDPQIRGCSLLTISQYIASALVCSQNRYGEWVNGASQGMDRGTASLSALADMICCGLKDESSVCVRAALQAVSTCLDGLMKCNHAHLGIRMLGCVLELKDTTYWLVKVDMLEVFADVSFRQVLFAQETAPDVEKLKDFSLLGTLHQEILELAFESLKDKDPRVRKAASMMLVKSVSNFGVVIDSLKCDMATSEAAIICSEFNVSAGSTESADPAQKVKNLLKIYHGFEKMDDLSFVSHNLSCLVGKLTELLSFSTSKHLTQGAIQTLLALSVEFSVSKNPTAYSCQFVPDTRIPDSKKQLTGLLPMLVSMLESTWPPLEISAHVNLMSLAGNYVAGIAYHSFQITGPNPKMTDQDTLLPSKGSPSLENPAAMSAILDPQVGALAQKLFAHILKLLAMAHHVITETTPTLPNKSVLQTLQTAPSLPNTLKKKEKVDVKESAASNEQKTHKKSSSGGKIFPSGDENEKDKPSKSNQNSPFGFAHSRVYMKVHEVLSGAYETYKTTLESEDVDKFSSFLQCVLDSFCQILELATFVDIERYTEDILSYLKTIFTVEPTMVVQAVQQLLKGLFGTNLVSQLDLDDRIRVKQSPALSNDQQHYRANFYHQVFHRPLNDFTMAIANASFHHYLQQENTQKTSSGWFGSIKKKVEMKLSQTAKRSKGDKMSIQNYIRLFESIVIKSLKNYTMTSSAEFQKHVLNLLAQLVQLRVNYCLLDSDQIFIGFIIKQFESIEGGLVRNSEALIPHVFFFLVLLSYEKHHSKSVITMPKIIQLCDGVMASGCDALTHVIPALRPIVHDLFVLRAGQRQDNSSDLDTQREVTQSMLFRIIENPEALVMTTTILQYYRRENPEQWKKFSRQVTDVLLPLMSHQKLKIFAHSEVSFLHRLFEALSPTALRPIDLVLSIFFMLPSDLRTLPHHQRWMLKLVALLRVLLCHLKEDFLLQRVREMQIESMAFSCSVLESLQQGSLAANTENSVPQRGAEARPPQGEVLAQIFLQIIGTTLQRIVSESFDPAKVSKKKDLRLLSQLLGEFILAITYICRSGSFRHLTNAMKSVLSIPQEQCDPNVYSVDVLCTNFHLAMNRYPLLTLLWSQLLTCAGYTDLTAWGKFTGKNLLNPGTSMPFLSEGMIRRGAIIMLADYICQNQSAVEAMSWLIVNHMKEILALHGEPPIQDFTSAIHRSASASGLFIESVKLLLSSDARIRVSLKHRILFSVSGLHLKQSAAVLALLLTDNWFLFSPVLSVSECSDRMACSRVEMMLVRSNSNGDVADNSTLLSRLDALQPQIEKCKTVSRFGRLVGLVKRLRHFLANGHDNPDVIHDEILRGTSEHVSEPSKAWFKRLTFQFSKGNHRGCDIARLLNVLDYEDIFEILQNESFALRNVQECLSVAINEITRPDDATMRYSNDASSPLLKAVLKILMAHLNTFVNKLPILSYDFLTHPDATTFDVNFENATAVSEHWRKVFGVFQAPENQLVRNVLSDSFTSFLIWEPFIEQTFQEVADSYDKILRLAIACHEFLLWSAINKKQTSVEVKISCMELFNQLMQRPEVQKLFYSDAGVGFAMTLANSLYILQCSGKSEALPSVQSLLCQKSNALFVVLKACRLLDDSLNRGDFGVSFALADPYRRSLQLLLCHPFFNKMARVPSLLFKDDMTAAEIQVLADEPPAEYLQERDTLYEYVGRTNALGWISRMQFEETWTTLLGVLVSQPIGDISHNAATVDETAVQISCITISALTSLVVSASKQPQGVQPVVGAFQNIPRANPSSLPDNKIGHDLRAIQCTIERELTLLTSGAELWQKFARLQLASNCLRVIDSVLVPNNIFKSCLRLNPERRDQRPSHYGIGQRSVRSFWILHSITPLDVQDSFLTDDDNVGRATSSDGTDSENEEPIVTEMRVIAPRPTPVRTTHPEAVDAQSCIQFLIDLFSEWFRSSSMVSTSNQQSPLQASRIPRQFLCECVRALILISDFFTERRQFEWMFHSLNSLQAVQPAEDEIMLQYLVLGMCKSGAILGLNKKVCDTLTGMMEAALNSALVSCQSFALYGALYVLEAELQDGARNFVNLVSKFVLERLRSANLLALFHSQQLLRNVVTVGIYLIEKAQVFHAPTYPKAFMQGVVAALTSSSDQMPTDLYVLLIRSLETLITCYSLSGVDCNTIAKLACDQFSISESPAHVLTSLNLMITCMYFCMLRISGANPSGDEAHESRLLSMERITLLFRKIKSGLSQKSSAVVRILPGLLDTFFSTQDMMNKVIGEFASSLHPHPEIVAEIMHSAFQILHSRGESMVVSEWVMLSLGNFTQRKPVRTALWYLTCLFVSASTNYWINSTLHIVLNQADNPESSESDYENFYISAKDFYVNQLITSLDRRSFVSIIKSAVGEGNPYQNLLDMIDKLGIDLG